MTRTICAAKVSHGNSGKTVEDGAKLCIERYYEDCSKTTEATYLKMHHKMGCGVIVFCSGNEVSSYFQSTTNLSLKRFA